MTAHDIEEKIDLLMIFGKTFHNLGANSPRMEAALQQFSTKLGLEGSFFFTPTYIMSSFQTPKGEVSRHLRVVPGSVDLEKLSEVDELADSFIAGKFSLSETKFKLNEINQRRNRYPFWLRIISMGVVASSVSALLSTNVSDFIVSFFAGILVGVIEYLAARSEKISEMKEALEAFFIYFLASFVSLAYPTISLKVVVLSGLIPVLPGLTLTIAIAELAANHLASGTARLMGSLITLLKISFGVALAAKLIDQTLVIHPIEATMQLPQWVSRFSFIFSGLCFTVIFKARPKDTFFVVLASILGVLGVRQGVELLGPEIGSFLGGLTIGVASNLYARTLNRPALIILLPGIILSVPGSLGYKSLSLMFNHDVLMGLNTAFSTISIAVSIVAGLLFGNLLINPRRNL